MVFLLASSEHGGDDLGRCRRGDDAIRIHQLTG